MELYNIRSMLYSRGSTVLCLLESDNFFIVLNDNPSEPYLYRKACGLEQKIHSAMNFFYLSEYVSKWTWFCEALIILGHEKYNPC